LIGVVWDPSQQRVGEVSVADGFGDVVVHAGVEASFAVAGHGIGGHGDHRSMSGDALAAS
jgi:hypothetical protein